ncbi:hypothetical protein B0O99DRAFT_510829 [Bisporella sp. PMI_857]|nr:hypothetical protein B0O99DRAFT_510829 [Bisporella sp. PMI_857]
MTFLLSYFLLIGVVLAETCLQTIKKDVIIVGGGSSGVYTAIHLSDLGKDVAIIEQSGFLGSHANTYYNPSTGELVNVGVQSLHNTSIVREYLERLNITARREAIPQFQTVNVDFMEGVAKPNFASPSQDDVFQGFQTFANILSEKYAYLDRGFFLPDPIPEELFLPFATFAAKYGIEAIIESIAVFIQPVEIWKEPTLYVIKNFGLQSTLSYLELISQGLYRPHDVNEIYRSASKELGSKVLYNSSAAAVRRSPEGVSVVVKTPSGNVCFNACKIIMTAPPFLHNFRGWDLTRNEMELFSKFKGKSSQIAILHNPRWNNTQYHGVGPNSTSGTPILPAVVEIVPNGLSDDSYHSYTVSANPFPVKDAKAIFSQQLKTLQDKGIVPQGETKILEWFDHKDYMNYVSVDDIRAGFYSSLYNLQGTKNTWYTGAVWAGQDSSYIWSFTKALLPRIVK